MAGFDHRGPGFSNDEKNYLLAEIIKCASISPTNLLNVVLANQIQPRWEDMPLPPGRSLNACRSAFDELKRHAYSPLSQTTPQTPLSAPISGSLKRPWGSEAPLPRAIMPKVAPSSGMGLPPQNISHIGQAQPPKRKRGRPPKNPPPTQLEPTALAALVSAAGPTYTPREALQYTAPLPSMQSSYPPGPPAPDPRASLPPPQRVPISGLISTPTGQKTSSNSSSSSGKRRRGRSMRLEPGSMAQMQPPVYESPYAVQAEQRDSPAQAAIMRHREISGAGTMPPMIPGPPLAPAPALEQVAQQPSEPRMDIAGPDRPPSSGPPEPPRPQA
nr:hypothetical protein B0A51_01032 [Rachicladosporium sp. CCFEE 5018]